MSADAREGCACACATALTESSPSGVVARQIPRLSLDGLAAVGQGAEPVVDPPVAHAGGGYRSATGMPSSGAKDKAAHRIASGSSSARRSPSRSASRLGRLRNGALGQGALGYLVQRRAGWPA